jgi:ABC-2 type transport system ATP-binding protein
VSQKPAFDPVGTGRENLVLAARVHGAPAADARRRAADLLDRFDLTPAADRQAGTWSGGMQRKLDLAMGLVHRPRVLFLDEPTTGLDPRARLDLWAAIEGLAHHDGLTVLLTTHHLEEADRLAGHLVIVDAGRVVAAGSPDQLKDGLGGDFVRVGLADRTQAGRAVEALAGLDSVAVDGALLRARVGDGAAALPGILAALTAAGIDLTAAGVARPSLDDVYLHHAGRDFHEADHAGAVREEVAA